MVMKNHVSEAYYHMKWISLPQTPLVGSPCLDEVRARIFRRKSAKDISIWTYAFLLVAGVIWTLYGFNIQSFSLVITNLIGSLVLIGVIVGWILYGR